MKVFLKKALKTDKVTLEKGAEGHIWCCLLHNDSYLVDFKEIRVELDRSDVEFAKVI